MARTTLAVATLAASILMLGAASEESWSEKMQDMHKTLARIFPDLISEKQFNDKKGFSRVKKHTKELMKQAHTLSDMQKSGKAIPYNDPSVKFILESFNSEVERVDALFAEGRNEFARRKLKTVTAYCISCHTRGNQGLEFLDNNLGDLKNKFTPMERADYLAATRRFGQALEIYQSILADPHVVKNNRLDWGTALQRALQISIRVKHNPSETLKVVQRAASAPGLSAATQSYVKSWEQSIKAWQNEKPHAEYTPEQLLKEARRLVSLAEKSQKFPADETADIYFMRASSVAHELMQLEAKPPVQAEALYLAGQSYEAINDVGIWDLHEMLYEACIHTLPHSQQAEQCYSKLKSSIEFGFTGSSGMDIPDGIQNQLARLSKLAKRKK